MKRRIFLALVVLLLAVPLALYGTGQLTAVTKYAATLLPEKQTPARTDTTPVVTVIETVRKPFVETSLITGTIVARDEVLVAPEINGQRVLDVLVEVGDTVKEGQVLARLVTTNLDAQIAQNEAAIARTKAAMAQARSTIAVAKANLTQVAASLERARPLRRSGTIAQATYDQRLAAAQTARAQLESAHSGLTAAEAEHEQFLAQARELKWRRDATEVRAPTAGIVSEKSARIGAMANAAGEPMFKIIRDGARELDGEATADQLARLRSGQSATVKVAGGSSVSGTVRLISPRVDPATRLGRVLISLPNDPSLRIGLFAEAEVISARSTGLAIASTAIMYDGDTRYVFTVENGIVKRHDIATGLQANSQIEVTEGLAEGMRVVAKAGTFLQAGDKVRAVRASPTQVSKAN